MEKELSKSLPVHIEQVVKNKKILLFKEMIRDIGYDDSSVADLLVNGVQVVGCLEVLSIWPQADNSPKCSVSEIERFSSAAQRKLRDHTARGGVVQEVWDQTMEEVNAGLLGGPYSDDQLAGLLGAK